jgi:hypothetical protein
MCRLLFLNGIRLSGGGQAGNMEAAEIATLD